ncbi:MAG: aminofutalosine synthase MqnE [Candidatus Sumerlaeia bacterium]
MIRRIETKIRRGERLTFDDGLFLATECDLHALGRLAHAVRLGRHGRKTFFNINLHINPANVCIAGCKFCAFGKKAFDENAYILQPEDIVRRAELQMPRGCSEIHLVGGLHPRMNLEYYCRFIRALRSHCPGVKIKALTAVEIEYAARLSKISISEALERLVEAGLDTLPGGGAEIFDEGIRSQLCDHKCDSATWIEVHRTAHRMGIKSNCTMLYGHVERPEHRVDHLLRLRALQDETGGFQCFIPLAFLPENNDLSHLPRTTGHLDLRTVAVARLLLDNIPHIKAYWIMMGVKTAQLALLFGADDLDGTIVHEEIGHDAGSDAPQALSVHDICRLIREMGMEPVLRNSLYEELDLESQLTAV